MPTEKKDAGIFIILMIANSGLFESVFAFYCDLHAFPLNVSAMLPLSFPFYVFFLMTFALWETVGDIPNSLYLLLAVVHHREGKSVDKK